MAERILSEYVAVSPRLVLGFIKSLQLVPEGQRYKRPTCGTKGNNANGPDFRRKATDGVDLV